MGGSTNHSSLPHSPEPIELENFSQIDESDVNLNWGACDADGYTMFSGAPKQVAKKIVVRYNACSGLSHPQGVPALIEAAQRIVEFWTDWRSHKDFTKRVTQGHPVQQDFCNEGDDEIAKFLTAYDACGIKAPTHD